MRKTVLFITVIMVLFSMSACADLNGRENDGDKLSVVTTNFALYDFARAVCGDECEVTMLLSPGGESHDFESTLSDIAKISDSDLFIYVGGESEDWVEDVFSSLESMGEDVNSMCVLDSVEKYTEEIKDGMTHIHNEAHGEDHSHPEGEWDEHVWTSIPNAVSIMEDIRDRLSEIDSDIAKKLSENTEKYVEELLLIDREITDTVESSENKTIIVADRFPFRYMAERYGIDYYAAFSGCSSDVEPSLSTVNFLINKVKELDIPIFIIEFSDGTVAKTIKEETGCDILTLHSAHNVTQSDFDCGVTYADLMRQNLEALKTALNQ